MPKKWEKMIIMKNNNMPIYQVILTYLIAVESEEAAYVGVII